MIRGLTESLRKGPVYTTRRAAYKFYELTHPREPWLSQGAVRFLDEKLPRDGVGIEWGSGRSTEWFGQRLGHLTSVESNAEWSEIVRQRINGHPVNLLHIPPDHAEGRADLRTPGGEESDAAPRYPEPAPAYVAVTENFEDQSLDFALVDGIYRHACVKAIIPKLKPGAFLAVDNTDRLPELSSWAVPTGWPVVHQSSNVMTQTTVWMRVNAVHG